MATTLGLVENLLNEFYHPTTQNWRKRQIESDLLTFKNQQNSWQQCICMLDNFSNQFLWFFNASTVEYTITRKWGTLRPTDRSIMRETLWTTFANLPLDAPKKQRDTIAQLIALMGKREFPDDHPNYISHILQLLRNKFPLGIVLLKTTSEELLSTREDVSSDRKKYFHSCVSLCMPEIVDILGKFLAISVCHVNGTDLSIIPTNLMDPSLHSSLPNDNRLSISLVELLTCIQHLLSWISLEALTTECFIISIFDLARWREHQCEASVAALSAINELFYLQRAVPFPKTIMTGIRGLLEQKDLDKSNEMYQDKFTELLRLYTNKCWAKIIDDEILHSVICGLYQYTLDGYGVLAFTEKLEIWTPLIKALAPTGFGRYNEVMQYLVDWILQKMQFRFDRERVLEVLDNESLDDNMETEWQHYVTQCIETIALIAEGRPVQIFELVYEHWQRLFDMFVVLDRQLEKSGETSIINLQAILRDISSVCQTLVRIAPLLEGCSDKCREKVDLITQSLLFTIKFLCIKKYHHQFLDNSTIISEFSEVFAQVLSAIRSLLLWAPLLKNQEAMLLLIENVGQILLPAAQQESRIVILAAAQLLLSISSVIRPKYMLQCHSIIQLVQSGPALPHLSKQIIVAVYEILINCFVLPWQNVSNQEQDFEKRSIALQEYLNCLAHDFLSLEHSVIENGQESKIIAITTSILQLLRDVLDYFKETSSAVKHMLINAFKPVISKSLIIFNAYGTVSNDITVSVSDFSLSVLRTFQIQLGVGFVRDMLTTFLDFCTREQLSVRRLKAMEKILQMLILVVEQPGNSTMSLIPSILNLSLDHILPLLLDDKNLVDYSEVAYLLYSLFDGILQHRWQYFYKSQVQRGFSPGASEFLAPDDDAPQHANQLLAILTSYGRAFVSGNDPHITRTVLTSLQNLNDRWKLFHRDFFKANLLMSFQCALINALLSSEGALHYDLLLSVLFTMGQVNISNLHKAFVSVGYMAESKIVEEVCLATDLPTFSQKMNELIQDTRCIKLTQ